jgi:hypothetical protein
MDTFSAVTKLCVDDLMIRIRYILAKKSLYKFETRYIAVSIVTCIAR